MTAQTPTFSILLLCWNHAPFLRQCLESLAEQELAGVEILFLDNGSSDGSIELAKQLFAELKLRATILPAKAPQGISANFNRLLAHATGDLVAVLSTDDWYEADYVASMRSAARSDAEAVWFTCGGWYYFEDEARREPVDAAAFRSGDVLPALLAGEDPFFFVGCCYRRAALIDIGGWDEQLPIEDRDLFLRLAQRFKVRTLSDRLVNYRRASSTASANPDFMARGFDAFFAKHRTAFGSRWRGRYAAALRGSAAIAVDQGKMALAARLLRKSARLSPFEPSLWRTVAYWARATLR